MVVQLELSRNLTFYEFSSCRQLIIVNVIFFLVSPDVTIQTSYQTVIEDNVATIHCSAIGNPTPKISWIKDGMTVGTGNTLNFRAHRSQSGDYLCSAENGLNRTSNASSYLDVHCKSSFFSSYLTCHVVMIMMIMMMMTLTVVITLYMRRCLGSTWLRLYGKTLSQ